MIWSDMVWNLSCIPWRSVWTCKNTNKSITTKDKPLHEANLPERWLNLLKEVPPDRKKENSNCIQADHNEPTPLTSPNDINRTDSDKKKFNKLIYWVENNFERSHGGRVISNILRYKTINKLNFDKSSLTAFKHRWKREKAGINHKITYIGRQFLHVFRVSAITHCAIVLVLARLDIFLHICHGLFQRKQTAQQKQEVGRFGSGAPEAAKSGRSGGTGRFF